MSGVERAVGLLRDYMTAAGPWEAEDVAALEDALSELKTLRSALRRADELIGVMSDYVGMMALSADQLSALNAHWIFVESSEIGKRALVEVAQ